VVELSAHLHPPLSPLPSREGKKMEESLPIKEGKEEISHQGRGKR